MIDLKLPFRRARVDTAPDLAELTDRADEMSFFDAAQNTRARGLYKRIGYVERGRRSAVPAPGSPATAIGS